MAGTTSSDRDTRAQTSSADGEEPRPEWWEDWVRLRDLISSSRVPEARVLSKVLAAKWPDSDTLQHYAHVLEPPVVRTLPPPAAAVV